MKNTTIFFYVLLMFGLMSNTTPNVTPPSSLESSTEFLGFLENEQYCYFRNTIINQGSYYTDKRCKEFVVRNANGSVFRIDTLWTEERTIVSEQKDNSIIPRKYKSTFNVFKFLSDNKVSTQENSWSYINLYNKEKKMYEMLQLKLWNGELYLYYNKIRNVQDSVLVYAKNENTKNIAAHLDNFLGEYEKTFAQQNEKIASKTEVINTYLSHSKPKIKTIYYQKKVFLVQLEWDRDETNEDIFDTYFTISESILEKSLDKLLKK